MPLTEGQTFAGYTVVRLLGAGGMGEVYLVQHPRLPRQDALKILGAEVTTDEAYRKRFLLEAELTAGLWHPHIVAVHDRGEFDGQLWIAMDYIDGVQAGELLAEFPQGLPPERVLRIVTAIAEALDSAHQRLLLHRDVKPASILIADPGAPSARPVLADFGIARRDDANNGLTGTNMAVGTVAYAAPEQLMGAELDGRADQYALAATAYHLLTGSPPFEHSNPAVVISSHLTSPVPRLAVRRPELAALDPALRKAMAKAPADRFDRCVDFARALGHHLESGYIPTDDALATAAAPVQSHTHSHRAAGPSWRRPRVLVPAALIAVALIAGIFAAGALTGDREASDADPSSSHTAAPAETVIEQAPGAVVGAACKEDGATGLTSDGALVHYARLQYTDRHLWLLTPGELTNPVLTTSPTAEPAVDTESPVRICMSQTGHTRDRCTDDINTATG